MAKLTCNIDDTVTFLKSFHRFGRLIYSVDTRLDYPEISRIHAVIEWIDEQWVIRDLSKNGLWLNGDRVLYNKDIKLNLDDNISFSSVNNLIFNVVDLSPPKDLLLPTDEDLLNDENVIYLEKYHFFPCEHAPESVIYFDSSKSSWCFEDTLNQDNFAIGDGQKIKISDKYWRLYQTESALQDNTVDISTSKENQLEFIFSLSLDEEQTELKIKDMNNTFDFDVRSHHYLTLLLARYKLKHCAQDFAEEVTGWVPVKQLSKDLGLCESHINIQIHRARKQFVELLNNKSLAETLIERKRGKVRFGGKHFTIVKGNQIEQTRLT